MGIGVSIGNAIDAYVSAGHTGDDFLPLVIDDQRSPAAEHMVERRYLIVIDLGGTCRQQHLVFRLVHGVAHTELGGVEIPIDGFARCIGSTLRRLLIWEIHQQVHLLEDDLRQDGLKDVMLRIGEGVVNLCAQYHFLAHYEVIWCAGTVHAIGEHLHCAGLNSRLTCLVETVVDDGYRLGFTAQLADGRTEEHIGIGAYTVAARFGRSGDLVAGGKGVVVLIAP